MPSKQIPNGSDMERKILSEIKSRVQDHERNIGTKLAKWRDAENKVLAFLPEREVDAERRAARDGGLPQYTTIQIPYSYAVLMAAHTYQTSVFMGRNPTLQLQGRHGETEHQIQASEALLDYQVTAGGLLVPLYTWLYDALKYGFGVLGCYWNNRIETFSQIIQMPKLDEFGYPTGQMDSQVVSQQFRRYSGNTVYNIQPQYFIWDSRFPARDFQKGEFCGRRIKLTWNEIVRGQKSGQYMNVDKIRTGQSGNWHSSDSGAPALERPEVYSPTQVWPAMNETPLQPRMVDGFEMVIEIIPKNWRLSQSDWPEKWVFTCTADYNTLIGCEPLGHLHCSYPYVVIPIEPEGYGLTTRGLPEILDPVQNTIDWLLNSHFYNVRASLNNMFIVDPSRIIVKDLANPLPGKMVRLKPEAYGTDTRLPVSQLQVQDLTQNNMADIPAMFGIGERTAGVNDQIMGMLSTGGRKTATEVRTSTSFGVNRLKTIAEFISAAGFSPLTQLLVQNSQQFYDMEMKLKISGDLGIMAGEKFLTVNPEMIAGFYDFVPVDGTAPIDRFAQVSMWKELMGLLVQNQQIGMQYDLGRIFQWIAQLAGLRNITQFKLQLMPDEVLALQAQQGNSVPLTGSNAGGQSAANKIGTQQIEKTMAQPMGAPQ
jgi:hypothetical protein